MSQQVRACHAAWDWPAGCRLLHHSLAAPAGLLDAGDLHHFHLGCNHVQQFADILAHNPQIAAAVSAACAGIKLTTFAGGRIRDTLATVQRGRRDIARGRFVLAFVDGRFITLGHGQQQVFKRQFQLLDLAFDLLGGLAESQLLQLGDPQAEGLNQLVVDPQRDYHLSVLAPNAGVYRLQSSDHRFQNSGVVGKIYSMI